MLGAQQTSQHGALYRGKLGGGQHAAVSSFSSDDAASADICLEQVARRATLSPRSSRNKRKEPLVTMVRALVSFSLSLLPIKQTRR